MPKYRIQENYGVCGPSSQIEINTTTLSSCSAIIMFNGGNLQLGLYHYGALSLTGHMVQTVIRQMINDVAPTEIVLWPAHVTGNFVTVKREKKSILLDNAKVRTFLEFTKNSQCSLEQKADATFPGVRVVDAKLTFGGVSAFQEPPAKLSEGRTQYGDIWWYHASATGSGEYIKKIDQAVTDLLDLEYP